MLLGLRPRRSLRRGAAGDGGARLGGWKRRVAVVAGVLLLLAAGAGLASLGDSDPPGGAATTTDDDDDGERQGNQITMRSMPRTTAVANAGLIDYGEPPPTIRIELTPGGPRYQLLLFQTLESVRSVEGIPTTAMLVLGGGPRGDLSTGEDNETGYTRTYGITLPANFRRFRLFGIVRVTGTKRTLVVYDEVERLSDPR